MSTQLLCENCGASNTIEAVYCKSCGFNLRDILRSDEMTAFVAEPTEDALKNISHRKAYFARTAKLILRHEETNTDYIPDLSKNTFTIGRKPPEDATFPHLDLSEKGAAEKGVSRQHTRITRMNAVLVLEDLAALNGTFVNGDRISAVKPVVLCDRDEIRLGKLKLRVIFEV